MLFGLGRVNFKMLLFENTNPFRFSDLQVQIVRPLFSWEGKESFKKVAFFAKLGNIFWVLSKIPVVWWGTNWER